ncbi:CPBP family intramembrane glutamic endopeptidase [Cyanobacterium aponinum UTEX 3222]|uniref:Abortive infection protein n=2 Tax=Cyanobacterium aponinum TaxID=379064 RepID=K9YZZ4_CYAAP|nr:CPBP family intramembrane glutamic endopeptidase [Cyanobacterium aponinum]WRL40454.1 CPBP family intramembrane glutamic endopeptidase [Cyanobacterium aponinum UTEX 3222]AFZ52526.1 Abortive infection protein [Cyanobacterium aponinum PCC 10605]MBD2393160.1 CPBP family intramembrane metalloprotease [Cyanobacterium aponinum FACHB-4101]PHV62362.1 CPBP family intramembrane metalloprotease [Cyanobacterium aponinum IPPAS B-1201]WPF87310.1 CPBP family intramembrane glutamic endopeptidase [Cyanobacte
MTESNQPNLNSFTRTQILGFMGITALILLIISQIWQRLGKINLIPVKFNLHDFSMGVLIAIAIILASSILTRVWEDYRHSAEKYLNLIISPLILADLIWVGLLPGLSEELLFRGVMLPAFGYDWLALILSSVFFGILHWSEVSSWHYVVWAIIIGFVLGYSAYITGNLLVPIVAHSLTNFVSSLLWKLKHP